MNAFRSKANPTEAEAVAVAISGRLAPRLRIATQALGRLLRDPDDTTQVFLLYVSLNAGSLPDVLRRFAAEPDGPRLMAEKPALDSRSIDFDHLASLPADTLGVAFARHMRENGLSPDVFQSPEGVPPEVAFLIQRLRQSHDLWHVVTGYGTDVVDELALQAFTYGQIRSPGPLILSTVGALRWGLRDPQVIKRVREGYRRGCDARPLCALPWELLWETPLTDLRARLGVVPARVLSKAAPRAT